MNEHISVMTDFGELIATPFAGGISVDINLPDGKGSGQLAFIESTPAELQDDYPTPVHVFSFDGRDSEPVHRTDVHLDGDAMTLDPVKGTPAHNGAQAHGGDRHPADLAKAASAAANRTVGSHTAAADFFAAAARVAGDAFSRTTATFLRACSALSRASAYLVSARRLAPYRSMYFAAFAV